MRKTIEICMWAAVLAATPGALAQETPAAKAPEAERAPGKRLSVQFQETRQRGEVTTATRPCVLTLHADAKPAWVFVGTQVALTASDRGASTTIFKNAGVEAQVSAETLPDGRYRLDAKFEESSVLAAGHGAAAPVAGDNPIIQIVRGESRLTLREGEAVPFASAVDPVTGAVVRVDVTVSTAPAPEAAFKAGSEEARLRARFLLTRRHGERTVARRPYSVLLQAGGEQAANVFSGSMLPVQVTVQGQPTVMLKDVGAGLRLSAHLVRDGRYRLDLNFSDGVLSAATGAPTVRAFQSESQIFVHEGETVPVASALDPQTGDVVEAEVTIESAR
jgi:Flp pilus assembly secretin CpaC